MRQRIFSSVVGVAITVPLIIIGGLPLAVFVGVIGILAALEMSELLEKVGLLANKYVATTLTFSFIVFPSYLGESGTMLSLIFLLIALLGISLYKKRIEIQNLAAIIFTVLYTGFLLSRLIMVRGLSINGLYFIFLILLVVWANDIFAYLVGSKFGKRKLAPKISPNKTIEGSVAGIAGGVIIGLLACFIKKELFLESAILGVVVGVASQLGDLFESQFKRWAGVKDSGELIPGHGGILDRIDGLLFGGAAGYYLILLLTL